VQLICHTSEIRNDDDVAKLESGAAIKVRVPDWRKKPKKPKRTAVKNPLVQSKRQTVQPMRPPIPAESKRVPHKVQHALGSQLLAVTTGAENKKKCAHPVTKDDDDNEGSRKAAKCVPSEPPHLIVFCPGDLNKKVNFKSPMTYSGLRDAVRDVYSQKMPPTMLMVGDRAIYDDASAADLLQDRSVVRASFVDALFTPSGYHMTQDDHYWLLVACEDKSGAAIQAWMTSRGLDANSKLLYQEGKTFLTPYLVACDCKAIDVMRVLLDAGANPNISGYYDKSRVSSYMLTALGNPMPFTAFHMIAMYSTVPMRWIDDAKVRLDMWTRGGGDVLYLWRSLPFDSLDVYEQYARVYGQFVDIANMECGVCCKTCCPTESLLTLLACGHVVHTTCLKKWKQTNSKCPFCPSSASLLHAQKDVPSPIDTMQMDLCSERFMKWTGFYAKREAQGLMPEKVKQFGMIAMHDNKIQQGLFPNPECRKH
jgi:hypothetical protein